MTIKTQKDCIYIIRMGFCVISSTLGSDNCQKDILITNRSISPHSLTINETTNNIRRKMQKESRLAFHRQSRGFLKKKQSPKQQINNNKGSDYSMIRKF